MFAAKNELFTSPSGYPISRSVRLRSSASAYFSRTPASATNRQTWTWSAWVKLGNNTSDAFLFSAGTDANNTTSLKLSNGTQPQISDFTGGGTNALLVTSQVLRDPSAWYHLVVVYNTTSATSSNRIQMYLNGVQITSFSTATYPSQNYSGYINTTNAHNIGRSSASTAYFDGYLTEVNFIDGQALTPTSFGQFNSVTGVWQPIKYTGTYGTNGFYLNFSDNSNNTAATIGKDYSGNGNNWTPNNISVTSGTTYDSMIDVPTMWADGGNGRGNYAVLNPLAPSSYVTLSAGNLTATGNTATNSGMAVASIGTSTGKYVWEETITTVSGNFPGVGATTVILQDGNGQNPGASNTLGFYYRANGTIYKNSSSLVGTYSTFSNGDVVRFELDADALTCAVYKNNTLIVTITGLTAGTFYPSNVNYNSSVTNSNFGQRPFANTPSSGFKALNTQNLPSPTISNGALYMAATTYTGNGTSITVNNGSNTTNGTTFKPDLVWLKSRSSADQHNWMDTNRGVQYRLRSDATSAEEATPGTFTINSNGFTSATSNVSYNGNAYTYVAWQWQAGAGTTSSNTSGSITSTVSVNATAGFSVVSFNSGTAGNKTVGHGLGVAPSFIITKNRDGVASWAVWSSSFSNTAQGYLLLNGTGAVTNDSRQWANTAPTSTVFSFESGYTFTASNNIIAYCFSAVAGYSAFGSYTGNGSSDGPFVFLGFRPRFIMTKRTDSTSDWQILDTSRNTYNVAGSALFPNSSSSETTNGWYDRDFLSNGFKIRASVTEVNASGGTYVYAAFAENPYKLALAR